MIDKEARFICAPTFHVLRVIQSIIIKYFQHTTRIRMCSDNLLTIFIEQELAAAAAVAHTVQISTNWNVRNIEAAATTDGRGDDARGELRNSATININNKLYEFFLNLFVLNNWRDCQRQINQFRSIEQKNVCNFFCFTFESILLFLCTTTTPVHKFGVYNIYR